ncbi:MAG: ATP-dependent metallopeptidase FtsH/Yme1/Tma family protein, partial [Rikenellaceae bacterium]|nr:ATP-dependent metallopeptidase FtsH/Yme1/Tma family protein [Rikenellaceae bacterium]
MMNQPGKPKTGIFWMYACIALFIIGVSIITTSGDSVKVSWPEVVTQMLDKGMVEKVVVVNDKNVEITLKKAYVKTLRKEEKYRNIPDRGPQFI